MAQPDPSSWTPVARDLLAWYDAHRRRHLPWREEPGPYRTLVSEVMLQQTRVETVIPYFTRFLERFPNVEALAEAPLDDVLQHWSGLGYYSRARNLHAAARAVVEAGSFPTELEGLRALPGVGPYMAGAVGSIALGLDVPTVDGNIERVLSRLQEHPGPRRKLWPLAASLVPAGRAGDFNQALMDLGSAVCSPRSPACMVCPLSEHCAARAAGTVDRFPVKAKKRAPRPRRGVALVWERGERLLFVRRPAEGLFGGLYDLPWTFAEAGQRGEAVGRRHAAAALGVRLEGLERVAEVRHTLTHMKLTLGLWRVRAAAGAEPALEGSYTALTWVTPEEADGMGVSTLARKALAALRPG